MHFLRTRLLLIYVLGLTATLVLGQEERPILIESKIDGKVLTITDEIVPPIGAYSRNGVSALARNSSIPQSWIFDEFIGFEGQGNIFPVNVSSEFNWLTMGLLCGNCFPYRNYYNFTPTIADDGATLLMDIFWPEDITCVSNPGNEEPITKIPCDMDDTSQHWFIRDALKMKW